MDKMSIRMLNGTDMKAASALVWAVFSQFEAPDYSAEGVEEFRQFIRPEELRRWQGEGMQLWGSYDGSRLVGVIAMRQPAHVSLLFVDKDYHRRGFARALYTAALAMYSDHAVITVNSSPYAQQVYRRLGFVETGEEQTVNGIRFIPMIHTR